MVLSLRNGKLSCANNGYATIQAGSLPDTVLCDGHDWTIEAKVSIASLNSLGTIFGRGDNPRGDLTVTRDDRFLFNFHQGNQVTRSLERTGDSLGQHILKVTHTADNNFMIYVDGVAGTRTQGGGAVSDRNYRTYDLCIGYDFFSYYFNNTIEWLRISDCIR